MRILYYELRIIWRLPVVLAIIFLGAVHYFLFLDFEIRFFPNGHPAAEKYALARNVERMNGKSCGTFAPAGGIRLSAAVTVAVRPRNNSPVGKSAPAGIRLRGRFLFPVYHSGIGWMYDG